MTIVFFIIFLLILMYGYIFYPMLLSQKAKGKILNFLFYNREEELPNVSIVIPLRNEEKVIEEKLNSILASDYPKNKLSVYIGLDACSDSTKQIIETKFNSSNIHVIKFDERQGKPNVLNKIIQTISRKKILFLFSLMRILFLHPTLFLNW